MGLLCVASNSTLMKTVLSQESLSPLQAGFGRSDRVADVLVPGASHNEARAQSIVDVFSGSKLDTKGAAPAVEKTSLVVERAGSQAAEGVAGQGLSDEDMEFFGVGRPQPAPLYNSKEPRHVLQKESAWHRTAAYLIARGMTQKQVAAAVGVTAQSVGLLMRQEFFKQQVSTIIADFGLADDHAQTLLAAASCEAALTLIKLSGSAKSESVQLSASQTILDRVFGRAVQTVQQAPVNKSSDPSKELAALQADVGRMMNDPEISRFLQANTQPAQ